MNGLERIIKVSNKQGIHARVAVKIVQAVSPLDCEFFITKDGERVNGKSIMGVMMLGAECGSEIICSADGAQAEEALDAIEQLANDKFGED